MFYGAVVKPGTEVCPKTSDGGEILHLSQACLASGGETGPVYLMAETAKKEKYALCALNSQSSPQALLDLFFSTASENIKLSVKGKGEIHVAGYFEPPEEEEDDFDDKDEEEEEEAAALMKKDKMPSLTSLARKSTDAENELNDDEDDDDDDDDLDESEAEIESESEMKNEKELDLSTGEDDEEDEEDEESQEEISKPTPLQLTSAKANKKAAIQQQRQNLAGKRKKQIEVMGGGGTTNDGSPIKKAKAGGGGGEATKFEGELEAYLRKHGRTPLASLGSQVKKPPSVDKLGQFMRERPSKFLVENGHVSLK